MTKFTRNTMTSWIEIADKRRFVRTAVSEHMPEIGERQHLHLGSAIVSLSCRIIDALTHPHADRAKR
jgi:hypothetical protein